MARAIYFSARVFNRRGEFYDHFHAPYGKGYVVNGQATKASRTPPPFMRTPPPSLRICCVPLISIFYRCDWKSLAEKYDVIAYIQDQCIFFSL